MSHEDRALASTYLEKDAFDLIVKPIVPQEASQTVCLALWQSRLLQLLTSKDRASSRFRDHMKAFPHALKAREGFASLLTAYERTFHALTTSLQHLLSSEEEDISSIWQGSWRAYRGNRPWIGFSICVRTV